MRRGIKKMKVAEKSQSGRLDREPKPACHGKYMRKTYLRFPPDYRACHVGWICMECGKQILEEGKFDVMKEVLDIEDSN